MRYAILIFSEPPQTKAMPADELAQRVGKHEAIRDELTRSGELLDGAGPA